MTTAIIGLVGVVVGSLATGGVTYVLDRRREETDTIAALRLLDFDLLVGWATINNALDEGKWYTGPDGWDPPLSGWRDHRLAAARAFDGNDWRDVATGFRVVERMEERFYPRRLTGSPLPLNDADRRAFENYRNAISSAHETLRVRAGLPDPLEDDPRWAE